MTDNFSKYTFDQNVTMAEIRFFRGLSYYYLNQLGNAFRDLRFAADENYNVAKSFYYMGLVALKAEKNHIACKYLKLSINNGYKQAAEYLPNDCK